MSQTMCGAIGVVGSGCDCRLSRNERREALPVASPVGHEQAERRVFRVDVNAGRDVVVEEARRLGSHKAKRLIGR